MKRGGRGRRWALRRSAFFLSLIGFFLVAPAGVASAGPFDFLPSPNDICAPSDPVPETAGTGLDALVDPPGNQRPVTPYNNYETAGLTWHATDLGCSDYLAIVGNYAANFVFMIVKSIDRVTITAYQTAYTPGLLGGLSDAVTHVVTGLKTFLYLPYVTPMVLLGVIWLAWHGLVRRRATVTVEGTVWMVLAVTLALWFLNRPQDILRAGNAVVNQASCAITKGVAQVDPNTSGRCFDGDRRGGAPAVAQTSNTLWRILVYEPWLAGEFGRGAAGDGSEGARPVSSALTREYGGFDKGSLMWAQAVTHKDLRRIIDGGHYDADAASALINRKHQRWVAIKKDVKNNYASVYPLYQGRQWGSRLGIAFAAFIAAVFAGALVLLVSVALIVLKIGFLLLIMTGPFFLLIGIHPGVGRVIAMRWLELLVSTLLKQVVVALALALLLFGYSVIASPQSSLSWGTQILLLSLLGIAAFVYRKPFQHLFASVGGAGFGSRVVNQGMGTNPELAGAHRTMATGPPAVRRLTGRLASTAAGAAVAGAVGGRAASMAGGAAGRGNRQGSAGGGTGAGGGVPGTGAGPDPSSPDGTGPGEPDAADGSGDDAARTGGHRRWTGVRSGARAGHAPPLDLRSRSGGDGGSPPRPPRGGTAGDAGSGPSGDESGGSDDASAHPTPSGNAPRPAPSAPPPRPEGGNGSGAPRPPWAGLAGTSGGGGHPSGGSRGRTGRGPSGDGDHGQAPGGRGRPGRGEPQDRAARGRGSEDGSGARRGPASPPRTSSSSPRPAPPAPSGSSHGHDGDPPADSSREPEGGDRGAWFSRRRSRPPLPFWLDRNGDSEDEDGR